MLIRWNVWNLGGAQFRKRQVELSVLSWRRAFPDARLVVLADDVEAVQPIRSHVDDILQLCCEFQHNQYSSWAKWYPFARCSDGPELYVDSDIIAVGSCAQIKQWAASNTSPPTICTMECDGRFYYGNWHKVLR